VITSALKRFFSPDPAREAAHHAYVSIVAQSRQSVFFSKWNVPDTVDGRFDVILLHLSLVIHSIESRSQDAASKHFVRSLSEVFFADMDRNLREQGAGDTGVGIRIKKMAQAFYGRLKAYSEALAAKTGISEALSRNLYREQPPAVEILGQWAAYCERNTAHLSALPADEIMRGKVSFIL
jgi:cytochrome b pre-mRNA-processing protein 3